MITANMHEAKTRLSELVAAAERGETVIIQRHGKPVAELHSWHPRNEEKPFDRLTPHPDLRPIFIGYDPAEPLQPDELPVWMNE
jgi:prevent-host-death family protein